MQNDYAFCIDTNVTYTYFRARMNGGTNATRRDFLRFTGRFAAAATAARVLPQVYTANAMSVEDLRVLVTVVRQFLKVVGKACEKLDQSLDKLDNEMSPKNLRKLYARGFHEGSSIGRVAVNSLETIKRIEYQQNLDPNYWRYHMEWEEQRLLRPRLDSNVTGVNQEQNDVNAEELVFVSATYKSQAEFEPYIPVSPRYSWEWPSNSEGRRSKSDFLRMYKGLVNHEIVNQRDRKVFIDQCLPIWYRWVYGGPGKFDRLSVKFVHVDTRKELMWTFNRPQIDPKTQEADVKTYLDKSGIPS
jgi:hypothetical protein